MAGSTPLVGILKNGSASSLGNSNNTQQTAQTKLTESASNGTIPKEIKEEEEDPSAGGYFSILFLLMLSFFRFNFLFILSTNLITRMQW